MNLFSSMLWAAQGRDGTELDQIKQHKAKPDSANWGKIILSAGWVLWYHLQLKYVSEWIGTRETASRSIWEQEWQG